MNQGGLNSLSSGRNPDLIDSSSESSSKNGSSCSCSSKGHDENDTYREEEEEKDSKEIAHDLIMGGHKIFFTDGGRTNKVISFHIQLSYRTQRSCLNKVQ